MELIVIKEDCFKLVCIVLSGEFVEVNFTDNLVQDRSPSRWVQLQPMLVPIAPQHNTNCTPQLPLFFSTGEETRLNNMMGQIWNYKAIEKLIKQRIALGPIITHKKYFD